MDGWVVEPLSTGLLGHSYTSAVRPISSKQPLLLHNLNYRLPGFPARLLDSSKTVSLRGRPFFHFCNTYIPYLFYLHRLISYLTPPDSGPTRRVSKIHRRGAFLTGKPWEFREWTVLIEWRKKPMGERIFHRPTGWSAFFCARSISWRRNANRSRSLFDVQHRQQATLTFRGRWHTAKVCALPANRTLKPNTTAFKLPQKHGRFMGTLG